MKSTHDNTLLRRTLQEIYSTTPRPTNDHWEQDLMQKIQSEPIAQEKAHTRGLRGWWIAASAVAAVALLVLTVTFWPQTEAPTPQVEREKPTAAVTPAVPSLTAKEEVTPEPEPIAKPQPTSRPAARVSVKTRSAEKAQPSAPVETRPSMPEVAEETKTAETLPPYERPRQSVAPRQPERRLALVSAEELRSINDFSLAAYDRLMGIAEETPLPEPSVPQASHTFSRVAQSMAATTATALSQDLQSEMASRRITHKQKITENL